MRTYLVVGVAGCITATYAATPSMKHCMCPAQFSNHPLDTPVVKKNVHNLSLEPILISHINTKTFCMALTYTEFPQECNYYYISGEKNISSSVRNFRKDELHF